MEFWKRNPVIGEINTRLWLEELSAAEGRNITLANVPESTWDGIAAMNFDAVWFMGVWERSPAGIAISNRHPGNLADFRRALPDFSFSDNVGSPYCIRRYVPDEAHGGTDGLAAARKALAIRGIKLILDFIPNHVAHDHPWAETLPGYFIHGTTKELANDPVTWVKHGKQIFACGKDPYYPAWEDVLQLNAFHAGLRAEALGTLKSIAGMCDGVRCDMAMLVMNDIFQQTWGAKAGMRPRLDYWEEMIPAVKRFNRDFIFIAEAYWEKEYALQQQGFDYCYDKRLYDRLAHESAASVRMHLTADTNFQSHLIRFIENHDEPRHAEVFPDGKRQAAAVIFSTLQGAKLFHEGQWEGRRVKIPVFLKRRPDEAVDESLEYFYRKLLSELRQPVFHRGYWQLCTIEGWEGNDHAENIVAWCWCDGDTRCLIAVNYSAEPASGRIRIPGHDLAGNHWRLLDVFDEKTYDRHGDELYRQGLYVALGAWKFHFLKFFHL